jgi:hypothetical protein
MKITKQNYPEYFLDYHEGRLPEAGRAALMDFLARHPELKEEFEAFSPAFLDPDPALKFPGKDSLKRGEVTADNYNWYFAAYISGDLSPREMREVEYFAETKPKYARDLALMKHTLLKADTSVVFDGKAALKRHVIGASGAAAPAGETAFAGNEALAGGAEGTAAGIDAGSDAAGGARTRTLFAGSRRLWYYASAAAVVMIMAGLFFMWEPEPGGINLAFDIPAAALEDQPEAVAEVPPAQQVPSEQSARLTVPPATGSRETGTPAARTPEGGTPATGTPATGTPAARTPEGGTPATGTPATGTPAARTPEGGTPATGSPTVSPRVVPFQVTTGPTLAGMTPGRVEAGFERVLPDVSMEHRMEFAYWDARMVSADALLAAGYDVSGGQTSLSQLAKNRLQESMPVDRERAESLLAEGGNSLRDVARSGVGTLERLASSVINPEPLPEEEGRQVQFALGNIFRVSRTASPE